MLFEERNRAESFGAVAELYDRARPSYPPALVDALVGDGRPWRVLDVGCGTGIAAALLAERGCEVLGVEVDERMASRARARGLRVEVCPFERWEPRGRTFELVTCGQAWHWIEPRAGAAKAAGVLERDGRIAVFWNFGDLPPRVAEQLRPIYARLESELENYSALLGHYRGRIEDTARSLEDSGVFEAVEQREFGWKRTYKTAEWLEFLLTHSDHQTLPPGRRERLLDAVGAALEELGGSFEMSYRAMLVTARNAQRRASSAKARGG